MASTPDDVKMYVKRLWFLLKVRIISPEALDLLHAALSWQFDVITL
jgi:hypothetical protein